MKAVHIKVEPEGARPCTWPVGTPFIYQSSLWRINGLYLATSRSGEREVWWILAERPNDGWTSDGEDGR